MNRDWTRDFLQRSGLLLLGPAPWGRATCLDARGCLLFLAPLPGSDAPALEPGRPATFQVATAQGFLRVPGTLSGPRMMTINGVPQEVWRLEANPEEMVRINRRAHFRVCVSLKGEIRLFSEAHAQARGAGAAFPGADAGGTHLERLADELGRDRRPCRIWDLGLGGVQLVTTPGTAAPATAALLDLALGPGETLRNIPGRVLESRPEPGGGEFSLRVRLRFDPLGGAVEARLSRFVTQVQRELLRKGIRA